MGRTRWREQANKQLTDAADTPTPRHMPNKYEKIGDVLLLPKTAHAALLDGVPTHRHARVYETLAAALGVTRVALHGRVEPSLHRKSTATMLHPPGAGGWTEHRDHGIFVGFDVTRNMFSSGNGTEKARVARFPCAGSTVVDLYAGIGYFTLPYLVHAGAAHVHACDHDADACAALAHNLRRNKVDGRCTIHEGDNAAHLAEFAGCADRVNLGLIPSSAAGWPVAVRALRADGGWLHVHMNVPSASEERAKSVRDVVDEIAEIARVAGRRWVLRVDHVERVKRYAPRIDHVVIDVEVSPEAEQDLET